MDYFIYLGTICLILRIRPIIGFISLTLLDFIDNGQSLKRLQS